MKSKLVPATLLGAIAAGIILAFVQLLKNRSLWIDEAMLSINILSRDYHGLLLTLDYNQVAPIGFLFLEKTAILCFGSSEIALRLFPFLCFLASIPLLYAFACELTGDRMAGLLAAALFALTLTLIHYSSEVKQYMVDVFFALLMFYLPLRLRNGKNDSLLILSLAGCLAIFMSNIAVILLAVAGVWMATANLRTKKDFRVLIVFLSWGAAFAIYYLTFIRNNPIKTSMLEYWKDSFLPRNPFSKEFYAFIFRSGEMQLNQLFQLGNFSRVAEIGAIGEAIDLMVRKRYQTLWFLLGPFFVHLLLSWLRLYPFFGRFLLYQAPLFLILIALGTVRLSEGLRAALARIKIGALAQILLLLPLFAMAIPLKEGFPIKIEEIKTSLRYFEKNSHGECLYVYYGSIPAFKYYRESGWMKSDNPVIFGQHHRDNLSAYNPQLDSLTGTVWLVFSHVYPFLLKDNEDAYIVRHMTQTGGRVLDEKKFVGSSIYRIATGRK